MTETLIEKLQAAEKGSRSLDADIYARMYAEKRRPTEFVPKYTTSIDAALTLVPEGWDWLVSAMPEAWLWRDGSSQRHSAANPVIALCIASLKAKQHESP